MNSNLFVTSDHLISYAVGLLYLSLILTSFYAITKIVSQLHRLNIDKRLCILFVLYTITCIVQYIYVVQIDELLLRSSVRLTFHMLEISFLAIYFSIIFRKNNLKFWIIALLTCLFLVFILFKDELWSSFQDGHIVNIYYSIVSFIIQVGIFLYLLRTKDELTPTERLSNPLLLLSIGILCSYVLKINIHSSYAIIRFYGASHILKPLKFFSYTISLHTIIELLSIILLNVFMIRSVTSKK